MQLGVGLPSFASSSHILPAERFRHIAKNAEKHGFAGAWVIEHLIKPPTYATSLLDPLSTLAVVAGSTNSLPIGTSVLLLPLRNPVLLAKRAVTIQHLTSRRLTLGVGTGYVHEEFDAVGVPRAERSARFREALRLLDAVFSDRNVTFEGEFFSLEEFSLEPMLGTPPRVLTAGGGTVVDGERQVRSSVCERFQHADGWIAPPRPLSALRADWQHFSTYLESIDRDPSRCHKVGLQYLHLEPGNNQDIVERTQLQAYDQLLGGDREPEYAAENWLFGTVNDIHDHLTGYEEMGFDEVILHPVSREPQEVNRQLRLWKDELLPRFP